MTLGILHRPTIDLLKELADFMAREWGSARLALDAVPLVEGLGLRHGLIVRPWVE